MSSLPSTLPANDHDLVITRLIDAPRSLVFNAWTDPAQLAQWWGPHSFTNPLSEVDARPGGVIRIHMKAPDGTIYPCAGLFQEVIENERLVFSLNPETGTAEGAVWEHTPQPRSAVHIITFEDQDDKTKLTVITRLQSAADRDHMLAMGHVGGYTQSLERLEALVEKGARWQA